MYPLHMTPCAAKYYLLCNSSIERFGFLVLTSSQTIPYAIIISNIPVSCLYYSDIWLPVWLPDVFRVGWT